MTPRRRHPAKALAVLLIGLPLFAALVACGGVPESRILHPLLDGEHALDVLRESRNVEPPPSLGGNRFVAGWVPWRQGGRVILKAGASRGRIEVVRLTDRERTLVVDIPPSYLPDGASVGVVAGGRDLGPRPLTDPLEIPLPAGLPLGRVTVELRPSAGAELHVLRAGLRTALPAGVFEQTEGDLLHGGDSRIHLVRRVEPGDILVGTLVLPPSPEAGQEIVLHVEREGSSRVAFRWVPSPWDRFRAERRFEIPLGDEAGWVGIRLEARGAGPPVRWRDLAIARRSDVADPLPPPPREKAPRLVVVYVMDALRADRVGHFGGGADVSPNIDRLAREGFVFRSHRSVAPNTLPSTRAFFTGRTPLDLVSGEGLPPSRRPLAEVFREAGYRTGLFSGNPYVTPTYGMDRGFEHFAESPVSEVAREPGRPPVNDNAAQVHASALEWLRSLPSGARAFVYLHTLHPHNPFEPPEPFRSRFTRGIDSDVDGATATLMEIKRGRRSVSAGDEARLRALYDANIAYNDAEIARFLTELETLVPREETYLVLTSDHGEELFDHGGVLHGYTLYDEMVHIPLVVWSPARISPGESRSSTDTLDLHATLVEIAGGDSLRESDGESLRPLFDGGDRGTDRVHLASAASVEGGLYSARSDRWKVIWAPRKGIGWGSGEGRGRRRDAEALFDLTSDPRELDNRVGHGDLEAEWLRSRLIAWVEAGKSTEAAVAEVPIDEETRRRLEALGYVD